MDGIASVCHQHDILSRQAMMYLLTMGWFLAHTSPAKTPEHSATNGDNSSLRSARAGHSKSLCLSSPKLQCDRAYTHACGEAGADGGPAQLANETPCEISKSSAALQCSWGLPRRLGRSVSGRENQRRYVHSFTPGEGQDQGSKGTASQAACRRI